MGLISAVGVMIGVANGVYVAVGGNQIIVGELVTIKVDVLVGCKAVGVGICASLHAHNIVLNR
ncbi:MAG: hypothetical protein A2136_07870 [Chloroflexi bacterium RBG_16_54_11]|nr:MAG: hypothetical protein A2136_07870 [Chloroflexi bacterium RBG_16_54_11]